MTDETENPLPEEATENTTSVEDDWAAAMAEQAVADAAAVTAEPAKIFQPFDQGNGSASMMNELDMILDIPVQISVELGRTKKTIKEILELTNGSIIELDRLAGEPVDIMVNGQYLAKGEVVVIDENFGVRITDIASPAERAAKLQCSGARPSTISRPTPLPCRALGWLRYGGYSIRCARSCRMTW